MHILEASVSSAGGVETEKKAVNKIWFCILVVMVDVSTRHLVAFEA